MSDAFLDQHLGQIGVDSVAYDAVAQDMLKHSSDHPVAFGEFTAGWRAVAFRVISCADHSEAFTRSVQMHGDAPVPPERYVQERELFGFFLTGRAAIESFSYALHAIGSLLQPALFPSGKPENVSPEKTAERAAKGLGTYGLAAAMGRLVTDGVYIEWNDFRNVLAHRVSPSRVFHVSIGSDSQQPGHWQPQKAKNRAVQLDIDACTTTARLRWLVGTINSLVADLAELTKQAL